MNEVNVLQGLSGEWISLVTEPSLGVYGNVRNSARKKTVTSFCCMNDESAINHCFLDFQIVILSSNFKYWLKKCVQLKSDFFTEENDIKHYSAVNKNRVE